MLKLWNYNELDEVSLDKLCRRPRMETGDINVAVQKIINQVRDEGDDAVLRLTEKYDGVRPEKQLWPVRDVNDIPAGKRLKKAFEKAFDNLYAFHEAQMPRSVEVQTMPGVVCRRESRSIERVGLYIPGGTAPLPSTVLMLGVPALIAGCSYKIMATPPDKDGKLPVEMELAAALTGIREVYLAGGAQAIAAMAYGTETVRKVDKIFGPGNQFVTAAKMLLQNSDAIVSLDLPAGPSEVMVVADSGTDPGYVASDLLSQAEHGPDSQVVLVMIGDMDPEPVTTALREQLAELPRKEIAEKALSMSFMICVGSDEQAVDMINRYAPEHLIIHPDNARDIAKSVRHAGSVFLGPWTPESVGDYASGTNHTLPTYGYARMYSGVSVDSFLKHITFQELDRQGLESIAPTVISMAETEQLHAHVRAVTIRLEHPEKANG